MERLRRIFKMQNTIQSYAWGSKSAISGLMGGNSPTPEPQAELWMGGHPKAPSKIMLGGKWQAINQLIARFPLEMLGTKVVKEFGHTLPYLFKILAAGQPLSIQAHPDKQQAQMGFKRENNMGIPTDAPNRNYKDDQHKPECMYALTTFWGLCGFRFLPEMNALIERVWPHNWTEPSPSVLKNNDVPDSLRLFFQQLMVMDKQVCQDLVTAVVANAIEIKDENWAFHWIVELNERYPGDIGVLSPLLLNVMKLHPGEAVFLKARQLHAYLDGLGIELMANSDNVLRGGLTPKHIDVAELLQILDFNSLAPEIIAVQCPNKWEKIHISPAREFVLSELTIARDKPCIVETRTGGPEIILCIDGDARIQWGKGDDRVNINPGESVFIPAILGGYTIAGASRLYKAGVNMDLLL